MHEDQLKYDDLNQVPVALLSVRCDVMEVKQSQIYWDFEEFGGSYEECQNIDVIV